ncbi:MAG: ribosome silencing factor [bacterium]
MKIKTKKKAAGRTRERTSIAVAAGAEKARSRKVPPSIAFSLAKKIVEILEEKQGLDPLIVDVREESTVTDYFVVVSGHNAPHLRAMSDEVQIQLKKLGTMCYRKAEKAESGWLVLDYVDVVTHILLAESRKYYAIEDLWAEHPRRE